MSSGTELSRAFWNMVRVSVGVVAAALTGRDLDLLDQLGEQLAAAPAAPLVLDRRPLGIRSRRDLRCLVAGLRQTLGRTRRRSTNAGSRGRPTAPDETMPP